MKRLVAIAFVLFVGAGCSSDGDNAASRGGDESVANTLRRFDTLMKKAEQSTSTFFKTEPFSQHAKITFKDAYRDWGDVRFQARLAGFTATQLQENEHLRPAMTAVIAAGDAWVQYFELIEPSVEGEAPVDEAEANDMLVEAKKQGVLAKSALQKAFQQAQGSAS